MAKWKDVVVAPEAPLADAIAKIEATGLQVALVADQDGRLLGVLTDGNIRRAILAGKSLQVPVAEVMNPQAAAVPASTPRSELLALMRRKVIHQVPLLDDLGRVVGLVTLDELIGPAEQPNWVVIMAGGLGTRLQPLTDEVPKPLLAVGGKPILETIIEAFADQGFRQIFLSVNYKANMIRSYFSEGERWGVQIQYLQESSRLGTGGALSLLPGPPTAPMVVMNGDLLTHVDFGNLLKFHTDQGAVATMAVREYEVQVPYGVVAFDGTRIQAIEEKPVHRSFINAGIYVLSPEALDMLPTEASFDMPSLFERLTAAGRTVVAYPLHEYWLDVGRVEELDRARREWVPDP